MPFFQEDLPRYLQPLPEVEQYPTLPMDDLSTLLLINEGQADPRKVAEAKGLIFSEDLGIIDPEIVEELLERISTYTPEMVWALLQKNGDNQVKVAYQLVRDHKRIVKDCEWGRMALLLASPRRALTFSDAWLRGRGHVSHGGVYGVLAARMECQYPCE